MVVNVMREGLVEPEQLAAGTVLGDDAVGVQVRSGALAGVRIAVHPAA